MRRDGAPLRGGERVLVVDDVEERLVDLADVVEERDALDALALVLGEVGRVGEDERVGGDAAHVRAGFRVVGVDGVEQRLERGGGEPLGGAAGLFATQEDAAAAAAVALAPVRVARERVMPDGGKTRARGREEVRDAWCDGRENETAPSREQRGVSMRCRRRPTLPRPLGRSTIGAVGLNDRVRDGNGCGPYALVASEYVVIGFSVVRVRRRAIGGERVRTPIDREPIDRGTAVIVMHEDGDQRKMVDRSDDESERCNACSAVMYSIRE